MWQRRSISRYRPLQKKNLLEFIGVVVEFSAPVLGDFFGCEFIEPFAGELVEFVQSVQGVAGRDLLLLGGGHGESKDGGWVENKR